MKVLKNILFSFFVSLIFLSVASLGIRFLSNLRFTDHGAAHYEIEGLSWFQKEVIISHYGTLKEARTSFYKEKGFHIVGISAMKPNMDVAYWNGSGFSIELERRGNIVWFFILIGISGFISRLFYLCSKPIRDELIPAQ